jgi:hypothetical protein
MPLLPSCHRGSPLQMLSQQSGSWPWVNLINSGVSGVVKVLSRYSAAGVDQYTVVVGQIIWGNFKLNVRGARRLEAAIMELKWMNTIGNMLHFGFGVDSVVRNLAATEEGGILVALCAAATESFLPDHAANIFWELVRISKPLRNKHLHRCNGRPS